jgi:hypothetical protein
VLSGLAVLLLLLPVDAVIAGRMRSQQIRQMKHKDKRVRLMNEILTGIKVILLSIFMSCIDGYRISTFIII